MVSSYGGSPGASGEVVGVGSAAPLDTRKRRSPPPAPRKSSNINRIVKQNHRKETSLCITDEVTTL
jgi:hypothetical protein